MILRPGNATLISMPSCENVFLEFSAKKLSKIKMNYLMLS